MFTVRAGKGRLLSRSMAISNSMTVPESLHRGDHPDPPISPSSRRFLIQAHRPEPSQHEKAGLLGT